MELIRRAHHPWRQHPTVRMVSSMTLGTVAVLLVGGVFCMFMFLSVLDDALRWTAPERVLIYTRKQIQAHWPWMVGKLSERLTSFAEWEKQQRAMWSAPNPTPSMSSSSSSSSSHNRYHRHHQHHQQPQHDTFYDIIDTITRYLDQYAAHVHTC
ncbi:hypothetical protein BC940DRAFT_308746 [Gongronella butleri]|nr:hypothetical protein BC940DRAFT_308746 [Gongronella butleri]